MVAYNPRIVTDGLVLALDAGNPKSYPDTGTTWKDVSGNGRDASLLNGPSFVYNTIDKYYSFAFDGTNDYVQNNNAGSTVSAWTPGGVKGESNQTIEMWVKTSDTAGYLYSKPWNGSGRYNVLISNNGFSLLVGTGVASGPDTGNSIGFTSIADGEWHQLVFWMNETHMGYSFDGGKTTGQKLHGLSGNNYISDIGDANLPQTLMTLYPYGGSWVGSTSFSMQANLASFRFYSKVLVEPEIQKNFQATRSRFGI